MRAINKRLGRKITMILGLAFVVASTLLFWFIFAIEHVIKPEVTLIIACILLGIGTSTTNICSFSLTSDLIGLNTECGAFVYGIMSFADQLNPCTADTVEECSLYYRQILSFIPAAVSVLTVLIILSIWRTTIGGNRHEIIVPEQTRLVPCKHQAVNGECNERTSLIV
jgi:MFS family permease